MFGLEVTSKVDVKPVIAATEKAAYRNFKHAAASISKFAKASIIKSDEPSDVGEPPHTRGRGRHNLKSAIRFDATKEDAIIGPLFSIVGASGRAHELGGEFKGEQFEERPFMLPALEQALPRFAADWEGSIR